MPHMTPQRHSIPDPMPDVRSLFQVAVEKKSIDPAGNSDRDAG
jgi:hypothetical protein